ncbi:unnamed protein product [Arabidopsis thaliana]|uniref:Uncharacterized protein n=1 Tax=Arabidopsis thaliana TaxID=3702 RepID=A0A654FDX3_ARATH|nr:unnamed protein product [Arabidopsis thaliana]VYS59288.1 unnamed protein product [Arabidopsis thaliana]
MSWSQIEPRDPNLTTWSQITSSRDPNSTTTEDEDGDGEIDHPIRNYCRICYLDLFVDSVSVSNNTNWNVSLVADSPFTFCQLSLFTVNGQLLQGVGFTTRKLDSIKDGHVVWDTGVKIIARVQAGTSLKKKGLLRVTGSDLPVRFLLDPEGNMKGSLVGNMKRCEYLFNSSLDNSL